MDGLEQFKDDKRHGRGKYLCEFNVNDLYYARYLVPCLDQAPWQRRAIDLLVAAQTLTATFSRVTLCREGEPALREAFLVSPFLTPITEIDFRDQRLQPHHPVAMIMVP